VPDPLAQLRARLYRIAVEEHGDQHDHDPHPNGDPDDDRPDQ
jgi:hypothetical protein